MRMSVVAIALQACNAEQLVYGKYVKSDGDTSDNSIFLYKPSSSNGASNTSKLPVVLEFHPGGFVSGGPTTSASSTVNAYLNKGIAYASVGYRLVTTKYYYGSDKKVEELVHVDSDGKLSLDTSGLTMANYSVRIGRQEAITKYLYDVEQVVEYLIANQDTLGIDPHRILLTGASAGGAAINHLAWVYHQRNVDRYTPRAMMYDMAQLNYPVDNMLDEVLNLYVDTIGGDVKLSDIMDSSVCSGSIGNSQCSSNSSNFPPTVADYVLCNQTWHDATVAKFCGDNFASATLGEVAASQRWPREDAEVGLGMEKLWYAAKNMQAHQPDSFYIYIANALNGTGFMDIPHEAIYARNYATFAEKAGVNYTVYYTDYKHMKATDAGTERVSATGQQGETVYNYRSSHDWRSHAGVKDVSVDSDEEKVLFACMALGIDSSSARSSTVLV